MSIRRIRVPVAGLAAVSSLALLGAGVAQAAPTSTVIAKGLNTPKYLTVGPDGGIYVAESGTGGKPCVAGTGTQGTATSFCIGETGKLVEITKAGKQQTIIGRLASVQEKDTGEVDGAIAVSFKGKTPVLLMRNLLSGAVGLSSIPGLVESEFGQLSTPVKKTVKLVKIVKKNGKKVRKTVSVTVTVPKPVGQISHFAATNPQPAATLGGLPGETTYDSDPHDVVAYNGGFAVADAGANDVVTVTAKGKVSLAARFPTESAQIPAGALGPGAPAETVQEQAVPSSVTVGPDGALYVGVLRGIPGLPGSAAVYRVVPGQAPVAVVTGLTRVSSVAFAPDGHLLILESNTGGALAAPTTGGALLSATLNGTTPVTATDTGLTGLVDPTGLAVDSGGNAYITNDNGTLGAGEVIKVSGLS
jgi:hypothetical protein